MAVQLMNPAARIDRADGGITQAIARIRRAWRTYTIYRETQAELSRLSIREREDIGLAGEDMDAVAREAAERAQRA